MIWPQLISQFIYCCCVFQHKDGPSSSSCYYFSRSILFLKYVCTSHILPLSPMFISLCLSFFHEHILHILVTCSFLLPPSTLLYSITGYKCRYRELLIHKRESNKEQQQRRMKLCSTPNQGNLLSLLSAATEFYLQLMQILVKFSK